MHQGWSSTTGGYLWQQTVRTPHWTRQLEDTACWFRYDCHRWKSRHIHPFATCQEGFRFVARCRDVNEMQAYLMRSLVAPVIKSLGWSAWIPGHAPLTKGMIASRSGNITSMAGPNAGPQESILSGCLDPPEEVPQKQLFWTIDNFQPSQCCAIFCYSLCTGIGLCRLLLQLLIGFC